MSKKTNTLLFILGATAFNILTTIIAFLLLMVVYVRLIMPLFGENVETAETATAWGLPIIFILSIVLSFLLYRLILKLIMKKYDLDKYFDPIFARRKK